MRRAVVAFVLVATAVGVLLAMAYAKAQAALAPAQWEPRALPQDWPLDAYTALCAGWVLFALVWAIVFVRRIRPVTEAPTATLPPPGTMGTFVAPFEPEAEDAAPRHWVKAQREPGPARKRYEARRRRIPIVARERRKRNPA